MYVRPVPAKWSYGIEALLISWIGLSVAFGIRFLILGWWDLFFWSFVAVGLGFVFHELAHREVARYFGCVAEYALWPMGLALALFLAFITMGRFVFAAPGAVMFSCPYAFRGYGPYYGPYRRRYWNPEGLIAAAGPAANILVGLIFTPLYYKTGYLPFAMISSINWFLAVFNLLPLEPLDGAKVFRHNVILWLVMISIASIFAFILL